MATNIPPHNLNELVDAIIAIIDNPNLTDDELIKIIPGPDFPTGGIIMGSNMGADKLYRTGSGSIIMRAKDHVETITTNTKVGGTKTKLAIIITELPYQTNKALLLEKIADLVNDKKLDGISDIRDESDRDGIRVVIELKRDIDPAIVQNNLYKKTTLQNSFSGNILAIVDEGKQPQRLNLRKLLDLFIKFRLITIRKRTNYQLKKMESRLHIVQGMLLALTQIDKIIAVVRTGKIISEVKSILMSESFGFSSIQADSILGLRLSRLTSLEEEKLNIENTDLLKQIKSFNSILSDDQLLLDIIKKESLELKLKHGKPRLTQILSEDGGILSKEDLIPNDKSVNSIIASFIFAD